MDLRRKRCGTQYRRASSPRLGAKPLVDAVCHHKVSGLPSPWQDLGCTSGWLSRSKTGGRTPRFRRSPPIANVVARLDRPLDNRLRSAVVAKVIDPAGGNRLQLVSRPTYGAEKMGQHYVPQNYLRRFADESDQEKVWTYDKEKLEDAPRLLPIKNVAQSSGFYTAQTEADLNRIVEQPAAAPIAQMIQGERIYGVDRLTVAIYIQIMMTRVPHARAVFHHMAPEISQEILGESKSDPANIPSGMDEAEFFTLLDNWQQDIVHGNRTDGLMREQVILRDNVNMIHSMAWRVIHSDEAQAFVTGDNPVWFNETSGLIHPDGEINFPLSPNAALHASWNGRSDLMFVAGSQYAVAEINRRITRGAERFVFAGITDIDVNALTTKAPPALHPFPW